MQKIEAAPVKQLAGMKENKKKNPQSLVQGKAAMKVQKEQEESDEPRDDFEGFGSITAMVQNKDKLVEKTMADEEFQNDLKRKEQEELEAKEKARKEKEDAEKSARLKESLAKKMKMSNAKARLQAVLDKSIKKNTQSLAASKFKKVAAPVVIRAPAPLPVAPALPIIEAPAPITPSEP